MVVAPNGPHIRTKIDLTMLSLSRNPPTLAYIEACDYSNMSGNDILMSHQTFTNFMPSCSVLMYGMEGRILELKNRPL